MSVKPKNVKYGKISNVVIMIFPDDLEAQKYVDHIKNATLARALQGLKTTEQDLSAGLMRKPLTPPLKARVVV